MKALKRAAGFNWVAGSSVDTLILGSMPGVASLNKYQYYAHPRNAFWPILEEYCSSRPERSGKICGQKSQVLNIPQVLSADNPEAGTDQLYEARLALLKNARVALWDVIASCIREGSLDANIQQQSVETNDFKSFFETHVNVQRILYNGKTAENLFKRLVLPLLDLAMIASIEKQVLPSTSPANARMTLAQKKKIWMAALSGFDNN